MLRGVISFLVRAGITALAFWLIFRTVELEHLFAAFKTADTSLLLVALGLFFMAQLCAVVRWRVLVPPHPALKFPFLVNSFLVGSFFNTILPTTVGGDVVRGYDLIKATGEWKGSLASILMDRLLGVTGFLAFGLVAFLAFPLAQEDPVIRTGFLGFCLVVFATYGVLGSRWALQFMLSPFGKIGLGTLQSHAKQFQESLLNYFKHPKKLLLAFGISLFVQTLTILMFVFVVKAFALPIPILFLVLAVPIIVTISQLPISLNGWGLREGATILFLERINIDPVQALSVSLLCGAIPFISAAIGGILFLARRRRKKRPKE